MEKLDQRGRQQEPGHGSDAIESRLQRVDTEITEQRPQPFLGMATSPDRRELLHHWMAQPVLAGVRDIPLQLPGRAIAIRPVEQQAHD